MFWRKNMFEHNENIFDRTMIKCFSYGLRENLDENVMFIRILRKT